MKLEPIIYNLDTDKLNSFLNKNRGKDSRIKDDGSFQQRKQAKESIVQSGFSAQQVEAAARAVGYDFSGVKKTRKRQQPLQHSLRRVCRAVSQSRAGA